MCNLLEQKGIVLIFTTLSVEMWPFGHQGGNANELGDDGGSSWKSSLFFVRSACPGMLLERDRAEASVKHCVFCGVRCALVVP